MFLRGDILQVLAWKSEAVLIYKCYYIYYYIMVKNYYLTNSTCSIFSNSLSPVRNLTHHFFAKQYPMQSVMETSFFFMFNLNAAAVLIRSLSKSTTNPR